MATDVGNLITGRGGGGKLSFIFSILKPGKLEPNYSGGVGLGR